MDVDVDVDVVQSVVNEAIERSCVEVLVCR